MVNGKYKSLILTMYTYFSMISVSVVLTSKFVGRNKEKKTFFFCISCHPIMRLFYKSLHPNMRLFYRYIHPNMSRTPPFCVPFYKAILHVKQPHNRVDRIVKQPHNWGLYLLGTPGVGFEPTDIQFSVRCLNHLAMNVS